MSDVRMTLDDTINTSCGDFQVRDWMNAQGQISCGLGQIPKMLLIGKTLPEIWERAVLAAWFYGCEIETQYDQADDPFSRDCTMIIVATDPVQEPTIHRAMPGGLADLANYQAEVVDGIHDHWIDLHDPLKWQYTYHRRMVKYPTPTGIPINQLDYIVDSLVEAPHTRRAQAIMWVPWIDQPTDHPPCLQRMWFRILGDRLYMNINIRSNDAFQAAFMNMFAFVAVQRKIAELVSERLGSPIAVGDYTHIADSFHIYGSCFEGFSRFLATLKGRSWQDRVYNSTDPLVQEIFRETLEN